VRLLDEEQPESKPSRGKYLVAVLIALVLLGGLGYWYLDRGAPRTGTAPRPAPSAPARDSTTPIPEFGPLTGSVEVTANVEGATVYLNGQAVGETPYRGGEIPPGRHEVRVEKTGFQGFEQSVQVDSGREIRVRAYLDTEPVLLRVESDLPGASVFVDRRYIGTTPLTIDDLGPGTYDLTVSAEGYDIHAETVELATDSRDLFVRFKEVRLQESVEVVHKHGLGSCQGRLSANPDGIRYETSHQDAFFAPFDTLETFEIDFTNNNLLLRVRGGRRYNFEEKSGNSEALFVFHQKVEAARKRLAED